MKQFFSPDELPLVDGRVYHLDLAPDELAQDVLVVGDPDRVPLLADEFLEKREADRYHRGFRSITGLVRETGMRVSIVTSGIGAPSTEIVLNELVALNEIDFQSRVRKESFTPLNIIRIGTSGGINPANPLGTLVLTEYVIGLDNSGLFYNIPPPDIQSTLLVKQAIAALNRAADQGAPFYGAILPYVARADRNLLLGLEDEAAALGLPYVRGITVSSPGFFSGEGRGVARIRSTFPRLIEEFGTMDTGRIGLKVENIEMEAGIILHFLGGMKYSAAAICVVINKRQEDIFMADYRRHVCDAARVALRALSNIKREG